MFVWQPICFDLGELMDINPGLIIGSPSILIVDDTVANLQLLARMLKDCGLKPRPVPNGKLALQAAQNDPPDLILLDITMPEMDGYEVARRMKANPFTRHIPILFISALSETAEKVKAFQVGGVDYITKPFQFEEVKARIGIHLRLYALQRDLEGRVADQVQEIAASQMAMIFALARLAEKRDDDTGKHLDRVQKYARLFATALSQDHRYATQVDPSYIERIYYASPLHDIGKVAIPDAVLQKPGDLTDEEVAIMQTHTIIGAETLQEVQQRYPYNAFVNMGIEIARSHHERWDGQGYPDGLSGELIPLSARMMAIIDVYDALQSQRVYKPAFERERVWQLIEEGKGSRFDPTLVEIFEGLRNQL